MFDLESVKELFKTEPNIAFFWSGLGKNGAEIAKEVAKSNGGVTLEMLMEQNKQKLIEAGFPYDEDFDRFRLCEKISVNSTTVIKNEIASGLKNSRSIFLQYTINTVIFQVSSTVSLLKWSVAEWKQTDRAGSVQSVGVHDLQLAKNSAPVSQRHRPLLCNLVGCQIQSL